MQTASVSHQPQIASNETFEKIYDEPMQTESDSDFSQAVSNDTFKKIDDKPMQIDPDSDFPRATLNEMLEGVVTETSPCVCSHVSTGVSG